MRGLFYFFSSASSRFFFLEGASRWGGGGGVLSRCNKPLFSSSKDIPPCSSAFGSWGWLGMGNEGGVGEPPRNITQYQVETFAPV